SPSSSMQLSQISIGSPPGGTQRHCCGVPLPPHTVPAAQSETGDWGSHCSPASRTPLPQREGVVVVVLPGMVAVVGVGRARWVVVLPGAVGVVVVEPPRLVVVVVLWAVVVVVDGAVVGLVDVAPCVLVVVEPAMVVDVLAVADVVVDDACVEVVVPW